MRIRRERYFSIHSQNEPGVLSTITAQLMEANVDCSGIWGFGTGASGAEVIVVPRNGDRFKEVARKIGWESTEGICFHLESEDKTGALVEILNRIAKQGINIKAVDAIVVGQSYGCYLWVPEDDLEDVAQILGLSTPKP